MFICRMDIVKGRFTVHCYYLRAFGVSQFAPLHSLFNILAAAWKFNTSFKWKINIKLSFFSYIFKLTKLLQVLNKEI